MDLINAIINGSWPAAIAIVAIVAAAAAVLIVYIRAIFLGK